MIVAIALVYAQTVTFEFVRYDDPLTLTDNPMISRGLSFDGLAHAFTSADVNLYHPATSISHMVDASLFGLNPGLHHLANVVWHALAAILLFFALRSLTDRLWPSAIVAALFALHPANVESVAWISQRKDTMVACFLFATFLAYSGYVKKPSRRRYAIVCILALLALLSKPIAVVLPVLLLVLDYWPLGRFKCEAWEWRKMRALFYEKIPLFMLSVGFGLIALYFQSRGDNAATGGMLNPLEKCAMAMHNYAIYLGKIFYPVDLAYFYPFPGMMSLTKLIAAATLVVVISAVALWVGRRGCRYIPAGWIWFLVALAPTVGFVTAGESLHPDRYLYLSSVGIFIVLVWGVAGAFQKMKLLPSTNRVIAGALATAILVPMGFQTYQQCGVWRSTLSLAEHAVRVTPNNYAALDMAGTALYETGRVDESIDYFTKAIECRADHLDAYANLGVALQALGREDEALDAFEKQLDVSPNHIRALSGQGSIFTERKNYLAAEQVYMRWTRIEPDSPQAWSSLGAACFYGKRWQASAEAFGKAAELEPDNAQHRQNYEAALGRLNKAR